MKKKKKNIESNKRLTELNNKPPELGEDNETNQRLTELNNKHQELETLLETFLPKWGETEKIIKDLKTKIEYLEPKVTDMETKIIPDFVKLLTLNKTLNNETVKTPNEWDVSNVTNMDSMFKDTNFNESIYKWKVDKVTTMIDMFAYSKFDQPLEWDVSNVTNMKGMFSYSKFSHPLNWNVSNVTNMEFMFSYSKFDQPLDWNVSNVTNMEGMFKGSTFNRPLNWKGKVSNVTNMKNMFEGSSYTYGIHDWNLNPAVDKGSIKSLYMIDTVETKFDKETILDVTKVFNVFHPKYGEISITQALQENTDFIVLGNNLENGCVNNLTNLRKNVQEFVECKNESPEMLEDSAQENYYFKWSKEGGYTTTLIFGPEGGRYHIEKPNWFYEGPIPNERIFYLQDTKNTMKQYVSTRFGEEIVGGMHCNQELKVPEKIYRLVGLSKGKEYEETKEEEKEDSLEQQVYNRLGNSAGGNKTRKGKNKTRRVLK